jgi:hypothetical protein
MKEIESLSEIQKVSAERMKIIRELYDDNITPDKKNDLRIKLDILNKRMDELSPRITTEMWETLEKIKSDLAKNNEVLTAIRNKNAKPL